MIKETSISTESLLKAEAKGATQFGIDENGDPIYLKDKPTKVEGQRGLWTAIDETGERIYFKNSRR